MAQWPFTKRHIDRLKSKALAPWGIPPDELLPGKVITDSVHGDIYLTALEVKLVDSPPLQRLRRVRQLGTAHLVYPGAGHSRFAHALGTLRAAQDLFDAVYTGEGFADSRGLFGQWRERLDDAEYFHRVAEAQILTRLGALFHDLGHIPFGHTLEDELQLLERHDFNEDRWNRLWSQIPEETRELLSPDLQAEIKSVALSARGEESLSVDGRYPFVHDIVGNTICADLIDYLQRDHLHTGLPIALGSRFINGAHVLTADHPTHPHRMAVRVSRNAQLRHDALTEILKYLRYRYELSERVLYHHTKLAADAMLAKLFASWVEALTHGDNGGTATRPSAKALRMVEDSLLTNSDDGLLQHLKTFKPQSRAKLNMAVRQLASDLLERRLYKRVAVSSDRSTAEETFSRFSDVSVRLGIEGRAANYVGVDPAHVAVWVPPPDMRLKAAEVLVARGGVVSRLSQMTDMGLGAEDVYASHRRLWKLAIYCPADIANDPVKPRLLARWFQDELGIPMVDSRGEKPLSLARIAVTDAGGNMLRLSQVEELAEDIETQRIAAATGAPETFAELRSLVQAEIARRGWV